MPFLVYAEEAAKASIGIPGKDPVPRCGDATDTLEEEGEGDASRGEAGASSVKGAGEYPGFSMGGKTEALEEKYLSALKMAPALPQRSKVFVLTEEQILKQTSVRNKRGTGLRVSCR